MISLQLKNLRKVKLFILYQQCIAEVEKPRNILLHLVIFKLKYKAFRYVLFGFWCISATSDGVSLDFPE